MTSTDERPGEAAGSTPVFRRTDRTDAPLYLSKYTARRERVEPGRPAPQPDDGTPLYLKRFRDRQDAAPARPALLEVDGERFMFCISYYEPAMQFHSEDPGDPTKTVRVLTVMRAEEY